MLQNNEYKDYILSGKSGYDYIAHDASVNSTALDNKIISGNCRRRKKILLLKISLRIA